MAEKTEKTDPVIDAIAADSVRRLAELTAPTTARRDHLRGALGALNTQTDAQRTN